MYASYADDLFHAQILKRPYNLLKRKDFSLQTSRFFILIYPQLRRREILTAPKNILVADPDPKRCLRLAAIVKRLDYNVFLASNSPDLTRITLGIIPHAVLLDLDMPPVAGQPGLESMRANRSLAIMKIISVGEKARLTDLEASISRGANAYVTRPISPTELYRTLQKHLEPRPRHFLRIRVLFKTTVISGTTGRASFATALSEQGIFIRTLKPFPAGTRVKVSLDLPSPKPIVLDAEVLYAIAPEPDRLTDPGMGLKFVDMASEIQAGMRKFIEEQLMGEGWEGIF